MKHVHTTTKITHAEGIPHVRHLVKVGMVWRYNLHRHEGPLCLCNIPSSWSILNNTFYNVPLTFPSSFSLTCHIAANFYWWWHKATNISSFPRYLSLQNMACRTRNWLASQIYILKLNGNFRMTNIDYLNWERERERENTVNQKCKSNTIWNSSN